MTVVLDPVFECVGGPLDGEEWSIEDMARKKAKSGWITQGYIIGAWQSKKPGLKPETVFKWVMGR